MTIGVGSAGNQVAFFFKLVLKVILTSKKMLLQTNSKSLPGLVGCHLKSKI